MALRPPPTPPPSGDLGRSRCLASCFDPFLTGFCQGIDESLWIWRDGVGEWPESARDPGWTSRATGREFKGWARWLPSASGKGTRGSQRPRRWGCREKEDGKAFASMGSPLS